jgi:filamentous hemagglutinin
MFLLVYLCLNLLISPVYAQVVVDPSGGGKANVINVGGIDVVNINAPNANGISHNKFTEYNVPNQGLILNNSNMNNYNPNSKSALNGEHIEFNLNFRGGDRAQIILNEVTGNNRSMMAGTTEIYGSMADLIVANPNGISCVGCGFINVDKF